MPELVERLMAAWSALPESDQEAAATFAALYTSPVAVNGTPFTTPDLVARARALNGAFSGLRHELLDVVEAPGKLIVVFVMHGTHTGTLAGPLGPVPATGREIAVRTIDVLTLDDSGRVSAVSVVSDELGLLATLGVLRPGE